MILFDIFCGEKTKTEDIFIFKPKRLLHCLKKPNFILHFKIKSFKTLYIFK